MKVKEKGEIQSHIFLACPLEGNALFFNWSTALPRPYPPPQLHSYQPSLKRSQQTSLDESPPCFLWTNWIKHRTAGFSTTKITCFWVLIFLFSCLDNSLLSYISCSKRLSLFNFHSYSSLLSIQRSLFEFLWIRVFHSLFCKLHRPINCFFIIKRRTNIEWNALYITHCWDKVTWMKTLYTTP